MAEKITRVVCPDCGAGGGSDSPCWCHVCDSKALMLPEHSNWSEHYKFTETKPPKFTIRIN